MWDEQRATEHMHTHTHTHSHSHSHMHAYTNAFLFYSSHKPALMSLPHVRWIKCLWNRHPTPPPTLHPRQKEGETKLLPGRTAPSWTNSWSRIRYVQGQGINYYVHFEHQLSFLLPHIHTPQASTWFFYCCELAKIWYIDLRRCN